MAEGRVKGHRYQQIYDTGDSSDGSSCLTRKSYSPTSKTPVQTCMSPNENLVSSHHEVIEEEQPEDDGDVFAPALRGGIVRLEENEEYPIKRHCFRDCTKKILRNRKKSAIIPFVLAFIFMVIFIVCILRITEMYWYRHFGDDGNNTMDLFVPVKSVVDVNLTSLNINSKHANKLKVTVPNKSSPVRVATAHEDHKVSLPLNIDITLNYENGGCSAAIRYWTSREHITGDITFVAYLWPVDPLRVLVCYKWGNITNPPTYCDCNGGGCISMSTFNISECFDNDDRGNDEYIIYIKFCLVGGGAAADEAVIRINITETYVIPNKTSYKSIYNDEIGNQNSAVLPFQSLRLGHYYPSNPKLYVNTHYTHYKNTNDDCSEIIQLRIQPDSSENDMEIIETVALVITAILSLLLSLMMFGIGIRCCCCHIKTGFCALGLFYEEQ